MGMLHEWQQISERNSNKALNKNQPNHNQGSLGEETTVQGRTP